MQNHDMLALHRLVPGREVQLEDIPTRGNGFYPDGRKAAEQEFIALRDELKEWQYRLYAEGRRKLLIVLQALDAGGKDGAIRAVFEGVNPQGVVVTSFKVPTREELDRDFLWRIHKAVPGAGMIGVFNRSHYEDVLVVRVLGLVPEAVWRARFEQINQFERLLADTGTTVLKFYLHISKEEQRQRLQERVDNPQKRWKFDLNDLKQRARWDEYRAAFEDAFRSCSTDYAPWYVIPADQNWYRNLAMARVIVGTLRQLDPQYPPAQEGIEGLRIE